MALTLFRRRATYALIDPAPIPVPALQHRRLDLRRHPRRGRARGRSRARTCASLETLLHGVAVEVDTPYTYERAAVLLERAGEHGPALSVCEAWLAHPAAHWPEYPQHTRAMEKHKAETAGPAEAGARRSPLTSGRPERPGRH